MVGRVVVREVCDCREGRKGGVATEVRMSEVGAVTLVDDLPFERCRA